ncbi:MAG: non-canonical purine NTP pyrophosphatase [Nanoarchaeota archaeon]|nr:non-canonical purine NTP pyrophosphatase [Nanoarchaeota archaeon]
MQTITFITGNPNKAAYLADHFHLPITHKHIDLPEIQSLDLATVVHDKAQRAYNILKQPVLVEDVALTFHALNTLPGPLIKWFYEALGNKGLCTLLPKKGDRTATAEVQFAYCDKKGVHTFKGTQQGSIAQQPRGTQGYGWDPIFIPQGQTKTRGEMHEEERNKGSMRQAALKKLATYLKV